MENFSVHLVFARCAFVARALVSVKSIMLCKINSIDGMGKGSVGGTEC